MWDIQMRMPVVDEAKKNSEKISKCRFLNRKFNFWTVLPCKCRLFFSSALERYFLEVSLW